MPAFHLDERPVMDEVFYAWMEQHVGAAGSALYLETHDFLTFSSSSHVSFVFSGPKAFAARSWCPSRYRCWNVLGDRNLATQQRNCTIELLHVVCSREWCPQHCLLDFDRLTGKFSFHNHKGGEVVHFCKFFPWHVLLGSLPWNLISSKPVANVYWKVSFTAQQTT